MTTTNELTDRDGNVIEVEDGDWIVAHASRRNPDSADIGHVTMDEAGDLEVVWSGGNHEALPTRGVDVYTSREPAEEAYQAAEARARAMEDA